MKKLLKWLVFWKKDTKKESRREKIEQLFETAMSDLATLQKTLKEKNEKLEEESPSISEIMQHFQEQLDEMEDHFEQSIHKQAKQLNVIKKDIDHLATRVEITSSNTLKTYEEIKKISKKFFNKNYEKTLEEIESKTKIINTPKFISPFKIYYKRGNLNYKERRLILEIEDFIKKNNFDPLKFDTAENFEDLQNLHYQILSKRETLTKECHHCGELFICSHKLQKYCPNTDCKESAKEKRKQEKFDITKQPFLSKEEEKSWNNIMKRSRLENFPPTHNGEQFTI